MSSDKELAARWDAELERRGKTAVAAKLASGDEGAGTGADFRLFVQGLQNPTRGYVEESLGRLDRQEKAAEAAAMAEAQAARAEAKADRADEKVVNTKRFHYIFWPALVAALAAVLSVVHEWIK
jgi:hypothetical protein